MKQLRPKIMPSISTKMSYTFTVPTSIWDKLAKYSVKVDTIVWEIRSIIKRSIDSSL